MQIRWLGRNTYLTECSRMNPQPHEEKQLRAKSLQEEVDGQAAHEIKSSTIKNKIPKCKYTNLVDPHLQTTSEVNTTKAKITKEKNELANSWLWEYAQKQQTVCRKSMSTCSHMYTQTRVHTHTHTNTHKHAHTYTHTHTHTHNSTHHVMRALAHQQQNRV